MSTLERLQDLLMRNYKLGRDELGREASLDSLGVDSLGLVELLFDVEDAFGVKVPEERVPLATIGEVVDYIERMQIEQGATPRTSQPSATQPLA